MHGEGIGSKPFGMRWKKLDWEGWVQAPKKKITFTGEFWCRKGQGNVLRKRGRKKIPPQRNERFKHRKKSGGTQIPEKKKYKTRQTKKEPYSTFGKSLKKGGGKRRSRLLRSAAQFARTCNTSRLTGDGRQRNVCVHVCCVVPRFGFGFCQLRGARGLAETRKR